MDVHVSDVGLKILDIVHTLQRASGKVCAIL